MPDKRVTLRRRSPYATISNRFKKVRTPGGRLVVQYVKKKGALPKCGDTGRILNGIKAVRPNDLRRIPKRKRTVTRCYGGTLSGYAVRNRIIRAFLLEEQKIVKKVIKSQKTAKKAAAPAPASGGKKSGKKK